MQDYYNHIVEGISLLLTPEKTIFWQAANTLIISDLHLGRSKKIKSGDIIIHTPDYQQELQRLMHQLYYFKADRIIILGDFTYSIINNIPQEFKDWRKNFSGIQMVWVKGKEDIIEEAWYREHQVDICYHIFNEGPFSFVHDIDKYKLLEQAPVMTGYPLSGHLRPVISRKVGGVQQVDLPCFYFAAGQALLPAFSGYGKRYKVKQQTGEEVYAVINNQLQHIRKLSRKKRSAL
jgi:DNA ligase-associated metallophosphoesterase